MGSDARGTGGGCNYKVILLSDCMLYCAEVPSGPLGFGALGAGLGLVRPSPTPPVPTPSSGSAGSSASPSSRLRPSLRIVARLPLAGTALSTAVDFSPSEAPWHALVVVPPTPSSGPSSSNTAEALALWQPHMVVFNGDAQKIQFLQTAHSAIDALAQNQGTSPQTASNQIRYTTP